MKHQKPFIIWTLLALFALPAAGQSLYTGDNPAVLAGFGGAAVVGDGEIIVGSTSSTMRAGELYVYTKDGEMWLETGRIMASDGTPDNRFGRALTLHGSTLLAGATQQDGSTGATYIFDKDADGMWKETAKLVPADIQEGDNYGRAVALSDNYAFAATVGQNEGTGAVYAFHKKDDTWSEHGKIVAEDGQSGDFFGLSISAKGDKVLVGSPAYNRQDASGAAYIFSYDDESGMWKQEARLEAELENRSAFGGAVLLIDGFAMIGAPGVDQGTGAVFVFAMDEETGEWSQVDKVMAFDGTSRAQFGSMLAQEGTSIWIGAPFASNFTGSVYVLTYDFDNDTWSNAKKIWSAERAPGSNFAGNFAVKGNVALIGAAGADNQEGKAYIFERNDAGDWKEVTSVINELEGMDPVLGAKVDCEEGSASLFGCEKVDLLAFMPIKDLGGGRGVRLNDIWGWTDPDTGVEYALVGRVDGTAFVDIQDPYNPVYVGNLPLTEGSNPNSWRDIKVYKDHAFIVADGAGQHGMQVFDLTQLRDVNGEDMPMNFEQTAHYDKIASAHNIVINENTGYAFTVGNSSGGETCGGGLHIINIQEPLKPTFAGCFADAETGRASTGYTHDAQCVTYNGPDTDHQGKEICFGANETALSIADVSDKDSTIAISRASYPNVGYSHQGWLTDDHKYFYMNDELDEMSGNVTHTRTLIWDVQDLDDPQLLKEFLLDTESSDHNLYIKGNLMYQSNYNSGLRILDITDIENPVEVGFFDTNPFGGDGPGFDGSWSNYPYFKSGVIAVSSIGQGMFLVKKSDIDI